jgi:hypothetical protein
MSQKVHPKSLRTLFWQQSSIALYTEGPTSPNIWGKILSYHYYLLTLFQKGSILRTTKAVSTRRMKKPKYRFSHVSTKMFGSSFCYSPLLSTFPRQKGLSIKYLPISFQNKKSIRK